MRCESSYRLRRPGMGVFASATAFVFLLLFPGPTKATEVVDRIVAVVNEDVITQHDVDLTLRPYLETLKRQGGGQIEGQSFARLRREVIDSLIEARLTEQEVKRYNISVSEEEIDQHIAQLMKAHRIGEVEMRAMMAEQGLSMEEYRRDIKGLLQRTKLVNREVRSRVVVTQEEVAAYYEQNLAKFGGSRKYHLWNLFARVPPNATAAQREAAQAELQAVLGGIRTGRPFEEVARLYSNRSEGVQGADLGFFRVEDLSPQLREAVTPMKPGDISSMVETEFGYQVVYVQEFEDSPGRPLAEVEDEIMDILYRERVDSRIRAWLSDLRRSAHIKIIEVK
jgi:peptidyl-prolyl cis-trans isomerase SurA